MALFRSIYFTTTYSLTHSRETDDTVVIDSNPSLYALGGLGLFRRLLLRPRYYESIHEHRVDDMCRPTQDTKFLDDKGQLIGQKDGRGKGCRRNQLGDECRKGAAQK